MFSLTLSLALKSLLVLLLHTLYKNESYSWLCRVFPCIDVLQIEQLEINLETSVRTDEVPSSLCNTKS